MTGQVVTLWWGRLSRPGVDHVWLDANWVCFHCIANGNQMWTVCNQTDHFSKVHIGHMCLGSTLTHSVTTCPQLLFFGKTPPTSPTNLWLTWTSMAQIHQTTMLIVLTDCSLMTTINCEKTQITPTNQTCFSMPKLRYIPRGLPFHHPPPCYSVLKEGSYDHVILWDCPGKSPIGEAPEACDFLPLWQPAPLSPTYNVHT